MSRRKWKHFAVRLFHPFSWSIVARRVFVLLLPLAIVAWLIVVLVALACLCVADLGQRLGHFWNAAPTKRSNGYRYYR